MCCQLSLPVVRRRDAANHFWPSSKKRLACGVGSSIAAAPGSASKPPSALSDSALSCNEYSGPRIPRATPPRRVNARWTGRVHDCGAARFALAVCTRSLPCAAGSARLCVRVRPAPRAPAAGFHRMHRLGAASAAPGFACACLVRPPWLGAPPPTCARTSTTPRSEERLPAKGISSIGELSARHGVCLVRNASSKQRKKIIGSKKKNQNFALKLRRRVPGGRSAL